MAQKELLNDEKLEKVTGGSHLSSGEVKGLQKGQILTIENELGKNMASCEYLGEWRDPGPTSMLEVHVKVLYLYTYDQTWLNDDHGVEPGNEIWISRWLLDFPDRA